MDGPSSDYRYAVPTIIGALKRHFRDRGWLVRPPRRIQEVYLAVNKAIEDLTGDLRRPPTTADIAVHTGLSADDVVESIEARGHRSAVPFDVPREDGRWVNGQVIRPNGVIGSQTQGHGPGFRRVRGTARSATLIRSTSTFGGHHEHH